MRSNEKFGIAELTLLHSERPKLFTISAFLSVIGLTSAKANIPKINCQKLENNYLFFSFCSFLVTLKYPENQKNAEITSVYRMSNIAMRQTF